MKRYTSNQKIYTKPNWIISMQASLCAPVNLDKSLLIHECIIKTRVSLSKVKSDGEGDHE